MNKHDYLPFHIVLCGLRKTLQIAKKSHIVYANPMKFVKIPFVVKDVEIRQLQSNEIIKALHLLYNVYVEEQGWMPPSSNKSGFEIREDTQGKFLYDSFVEQATWFGAWYKGDLVGCFRVLLYPHSELIRYIKKLPESLSCAPASELNRLAFVKKWRGEQAILQETTLTDALSGRQH